MKESSLNEFEHGDKYSSNVQNYGKILDFSASIGQRGNNEEITFNTESLRHYPVVGRQMKELIQNISGFNIENITPGYGLTSLIYAVYKIYSGGKVIFGEPIFSEHRRAATIEKMSIARLPIKLLLNQPKIINNYSPDLVAINSPVNPTGEYIQYEVIAKLLDELWKSGVTLFLDEAFVDFVAENMRGNVHELLEKYPNLIIGRSFSKISGLAGIRLGYTISAREMAKKIENNLEPWTVPQFYADILPRLLKDGIKPENIREERNYVMEKLVEYGCTILGKPDANYVSFRLPETMSGSDFHKGLLREGFLIRPIGNFYGFGESDFRIAILDHESNQKLLNSIEKEIVNDR
ncbi:aminotransferase class I/II-fold pyridoxal phosphate-dependent enzyme [Cuniculiplasma sp. SKW3]|uniref:aminotransferase class I/II-fold pyridoxal phosphate-dependent enzyme n=1 Tax=Cuniculiplasma sp. SKW3 TaxID=3400170 RepID=UPI003FD1F5CB